MRLLLTTRKLHIHAVADRAAIFVLIRVGHAVKLQPAILALTLAGHADTRPPAQAVDGRIVLLVQTVLDVT